MFRSLACGAVLAICVSACDSNPRNFGDQADAAAALDSASTSSGAGGAVNGTGAGESPALTPAGGSQAGGASGGPGATAQVNEPGSLEPGTVEPQANEPETVEPQVNEPGTAEPAVSEPEPQVDAGMSGDCQPGNSRPCAANGAQGNCAAGEQVCQDNATWGACSVQPQETDDCSVLGDDADCDGTPNEGCTCTDGEQQSCGPSQAIGRCIPGVSVCEGGAYQACDGAVDAIARDCSSNKDNDCDGVPDNTIDGVCQCEPGTTQACDEHPGLDGNGQCKAGTQTCVAGSDGSTSAWSACTGSVGPELQDSCNGVDDSNCNGVPNEGCNCTSDSQCNDNATCTQDTCDNGTCSNTIQSGYCRINGQCISHNAQDSSNPCHYCDATLNQTSWTNSASGTSCDDGVWCNGSDSCNGSGQCTQHQYATDRCADQSGPCVLNTCDEANRTCFRGTGYICDQGQQQYECTGSPNTCGGGDVRAYSVKRHCDGSGGQCLGDYETVYGSTQDCGSGYCDGSTTTCKQLGCGDTWCNGSLCWTLDDPAGMVLADAESYCANLNRDGLTWRLPSITEWLDIARGCDNTTGSAVNDVNFHSTCTTVPCDNSCPQLQGPNPYGCYWPTELGDCQGVEGNYSSGRYWSSTNGNYYNATGNWAISLSSLESLHVRCVASGSGP